MDEPLRVTRRTRKKGETVTKLYTPTLDEEAYAYDEETGERLSEPAYTSAPVEAKPRRTMKLGSRIAIVVCMFLASAMFIYVLYGYAKIANAYSEVNDLNDEIEEIEIHISALNASIECAVTIDDAQNYAIAHGMQYPTQSQYVSSDSGTISTPTVTSGVSGTFSDDSSAEASVEEGTEAEETVTEDGNGE